MPIAKGIILITVDSLRADVIYNCSNINRLIRDSIIFMNHIATAPYTSLSMYSLITSRYPTHTSLHNEPCPLTPNITTLAQLLSCNGYITLAFQDSNPFLSYIYGYNRGFNIYIEYMGRSRNPGIYRVNIIEKLINKIVKKSNLTNFLKYYVLSLPKPIRGATNVIQDAIRALEHLCASGKKFFIWMHLMDVHGPHTSVGVINKLRLAYALRRMLHNKKDLCTCPKEVSLLQSLYSEEVHIVDHAIGILVNWLKDHGFYDDVAIILTSDHGEEFCDHGSYGHTAKLYEELIRVPLIIKLPKQKMAGNPYYYITTHLDLASTILSIINISIPLYFMGTSVFTAEARNSISFGAISLAYSRHYHVMSYRTAKYKLICYFKPYESAPYKIEFYNIIEDPKERNNIVDHASKDLIAKLVKPILTLRRVVLLRKKLSNIKHARGTPF